MYSVSTDYIDKLLSPSSKRRRIRGSVDNVSFTEDDILQNSFSFTVKCESGNDITLGGVNVGKLTLTFLKPFADRITRNTWKGRRISLSIGLYLGLDANEEEIWEDVPIRPFFIDSAEHSLMGIDITAYDAMQKFDKACNVDTTSGKIYDLLSMACSNCNVELGMTKAQTEALPNGTELFGLYPDNDIETWRDFIYWIAVCACGFCDIDRTGKLVIRTWSNSSVLSIDKWNRSDSDSWSDFATKFTGISVVNMDTKTTSYYGMPVDDGVTLNIGSNPFLQYGSAEAKLRQRTAILNGLVNLQYVPFKSTSLIDPAIDLGDVITYVGGIADNSVCCAMSIEISFIKNVIQGYGKDPALANAKSKTDKNLAGLLASTSENELIAYTFVNASRYEIDDGEEISIAEIHFATINPKLVKIFHEIQVTVTPDADNDVNVRIRYYLNGELIEYTPYESWYDKGYQAPHILSLMYVLQNLEAGQMYDWEVVIDAVGGTVTIAPNKCHVLLEGQGLAAVEDADTDIKIDDPTYYLVIGGEARFNYEDAVETDEGTVDVTEIEDPTYILTLGGMAEFNYEDDINVTTRQMVFNRITESGYGRITEEGNGRITEGGTD